jgi:hypothetical protein
MSLRVSSSAGCGAALLWALALAWCGGIVFFGLVVARSPLAPSLGAWAALALFAAVGFHLVTLAVRAARSAAALRNASVDIDTAVIGGKLLGAVVVPEGTYYLTLTNWRRGDADELLWESPAITVVKPGSFSFDVPFDTEPTSDAASWRLVLESADARHGVSFPVPLQRAAASSPAQTQRSLRAAAYDEPAGTRVEVDRDAASTLVRFPLPSWTWRWYVLAAALGGAAYLASTYVYRDDDAMPGIAIIVVVLLALMPLPTLAMTVRRIEAGPSGLSFHYALRPPRRLDNVRDVSAVYADGALHYELAFEPEKPSWTILTMATRREAEWVAYELRRALRL